MRVFRIRSGVRGQSPVQWRRCKQAESEVTQRIFLAYVWLLQLIFLENGGCKYILSFLFALEVKQDLPRLLLSE